MSKKTITKKQPISRNLISKLHIKNFKSFFGPAGSPIMDIKFAPRITLLFGRNSAGKSSIIQAIKLIQQSYDNDSDLLLNPPQSYFGGLNFPSYEDLVSKKEKIRSISLGLTAEEFVQDHKGKKLNNSDLKSIIKKFSYSNNKIICNEIDFYSTSDVEEKFLSLINTPINVKGLPDGYYKSQISFCENKYAWKELFKYTFKFKKK